MRKEYMKQAKLLFLLRNDLASTSQRIIIEISEEDHEYCIGHGDDDREYVLKQNERYRVRVGSGYSERMRISVTICCSNTAEMLQRM